MFVSHIIGAFGGKSSSCEMPDDPFIQKKRPILTPFQRENRKIQGVGQKRKVQQTLEFTGLFWRRVRDSNPRFLLGTRHFECCKTMADSPPEQVVSGRFVRSRRPRRCKGFRTFRPVSAGGDLKCPRVQIKLRSCVKSRRSCAFARSQARKQRPRQHR